MLEGCIGCRNNYPASYCMRSQITSEECSCAKCIVKIMCRSHNFCSMWEDYWKPILADRERKKIL